MIELRDADTQWSMTFGGPTCQVRDNNCKPLHPLEHVIAEAKGRGYEIKKMDIAKVFPLDKREKPYEGLAILLFNRDTGEKAVIVQKEAGILPTSYRIVNYKNPEVEQ